MESAFSRTFSISSLSFSSSSGVLSFGPTYLRSFRTVSTTWGCFLTTRAPTVRPWSSATKPTFYARQELQCMIVPDCLATGTSSTGLEVKQLHTSSIKCTSSATIVAVFATSLGPPDNEQPIEAKWSIIGMQIPVGKTITRKQGWGGRLWVWILVPAKDFFLQNLCSSEAA